MTVQLYKYQDYILEDYKIVTMKIHMINTSQKSEI